MTIYKPEVSKVGRVVGYAANNSAFIADQERDEKLQKELQARQIAIARRRYEVRVAEMKRQGRIHRAKRKAAKA